MCVNYFCLIYLLFNLFHYFSDMDVASLALVTHQSSVLSPGRPYASQQMAAIARLIDNYNLSYNFRIMGSDSREVACLCVNQTRRQSFPGRGLPQNHQINVLQFTFMQTSSRRER